MLNFFIIIFQFNKSHIKGYDELFLNISDDKSLDAFDRNRLYGGVGFKFTNNLGVQLGYMRQKVNNISSTNHVLLSLHHKMKW